MAVPALRRPLKVGSNGLAGGDRSGDDALLELRALSALLESLALSVLSAFAALLILLTLAARWRASAASLMRFDLLRLGSCANWLPVLVPRSRVLAALRMRSDRRGAGGTVCTKDTPWLALASARLLAVALLPRDERTGGCDVAARFRRAILESIDVPLEGSV